MGAIGASKTWRDTHPAREVKWARARLERELTMDESTLVDALEQRVRLQLKPIEARQKEMLDEFKSWRAKMQTLETQSALSQDRIARYEQDLTRGLSALRKDLAEGLEEMEEKVKIRNKVLAPMFAAIASLTAVILVLVIKWVLT